MLHPCSFAAVRLSAGAEGVRGTLGCHSSLSNDLDHSHSSTVYLLSACRAPRILFQNQESIQDKLAQLTAVTWIDSQREQATLKRWQTNLEPWL